MATTREIICIQCPQACRVKLHLDEGGDIDKITDFGCKEGKVYAPQEYKDPRRVLTTTVRAVEGKRTVLPVRSREPLPKNMIFKCVRYLADIEAKAPMHMGDALVHDILNTGVDIICTDDLRQA